ncbi:protein kinase G11A isoform X1 [Amaranthus tricolor]|uniref:protein kinase G11A isoform X1 n=1 Tax=Amaranthus tricolor TaxID=29722 RepID=UPI002583E24B|nr:protein kinase G11A isoform X1 [Amaranthus tricolor]
MDQKPPPQTSQQHQEQNNPPPQQQPQAIKQENIKPEQQQQWQQSQPLDELTDDLQSMSFNSTTTTAPRSTSSSSETTTTTWTTTNTSSFHHTTSLPRSTPSSDPHWSAVKSLSSISITDLRFLSRLGSGDIGSVYLSELKSTEGVYFAAKVMDNREIAARNKHGRARAEKEILQMIDHPFLPTLYASVDSSKWSCLLTEFCNGGDLHVLRQRQPFKRFEESAVRFYAAEVVAALEYIHMMGIVYRDLKPENVLVRSDGHIMLTDFDLSLKCDDQSTPTPQIITPSNQNPQQEHRPNLLGLGPDPTTNSSSCILPNCIVPAVSCFNPNRKKKWKLKKKPGRRFEPEFVAEPVDVRSMSFVGTHEYLAPEIVSGEGHGSAVDWWTLGIFIFELFYGTTPFKGMDNEMTLANIVARALEFPKEPSIPGSAKDLISQLLAKDPTRRLGSVMGATPIKQHPFFSSVNWALLRCMKPPYVPPVFSISSVGCGDVSDESCPNTPVEYY